MTEGKIYSKISLFALPIFIGQLFQQFYNVADSLVVGRYLGKQALAAVSSSGSLIFLLVGFINGVFVGAGVVIGRYYGARENEKVHTAVPYHNRICSTVGLVPYRRRNASHAGYSPPVNTPADVLPESIRYFRLYFAGALGNVLYNAFNGIFSGARRQSASALLFDNFINDQRCS